MTHKHTPGPWTFSQDNQLGDTRFYVAQQEGAPYTPDYSDVATLIAETCSGDRVAVQQANARLIAKAPDLLASLQEMYNEYCSAMRSEFDFPGRPWTPERDNDEPAMRARALLVQLGGTP